MASTTDNVWRPMEPVEPRMAICFKVKDSSANQMLRAVGIQGLKPLIFSSFNVAAEQAAEKVG
jgi:hypothetical protein